MHKDKLTLENVKKDFLALETYYFLNILDWRYTYLLPFIALTMVAGVGLRSISLGVLASIPVFYHAVRLYKEWKEHNEVKKAIQSITDRTQVSVSIEKFSHIAEEIVYEPHSFVSRRRYKTRPVDYMHFMSGAAWRVPNFSKHYNWSSDKYMTLRGLDNISTLGEEYFFVCLQNQSKISYVYPCELFELADDMKL